MPVIIPISEHCHEPMTIEQKHTLIGCFILIHLIWLITTIISFVKYKIANYKHFGWYYFDDLQSACNQFELDINDYLLVTGSMQI